MGEITIKLNGIKTTVPEGITILEAAAMSHIRIPTLCYMKDLNEIGACRICVVEVKGAKTLVASCVYPVSDGMEVWTNTPRVRESRKKTLQLILSNHRKDCLACVRNGNCELMKLCRELGVNTTEKYNGSMTPSVVDDSAVHMIRDNSKCVLCRRCTAVCAKVQGIGVIGVNHRGFATSIGSPYEKGLATTSCVGCGQCIAVCPTGAITEKDSTGRVFDAIADPDKFVAVQTAPSVRAALGEEFGLPMGTPVEGKMVTALRMLGFDRVFDTDFGADLTIMEEAHEFLDRVQNDGVLPMITSCSPGWVKYCENYYPDLIPNLSTCKSPQQMFGAVLKTYFAEKQGIDPSEIMIVSIMPCTAKKNEIGRPHQDASGYPDVDVSLTTRELARMIRTAGIDFANLPDGTFDHPLGESTGAGVIFGATGGVMEAALRTAVETLSGEELTHLEFQAVRGTEGIKEAEYGAAGRKIRVAVASGLSHAKILLDRVKNKEAEYDFIEIMGCPGGCVNGGGQPFVSPTEREHVDVRGLRAKALYTLDANMPVRKSHENPSVKTLYREYLGTPGSMISHKLLHTTYTPGEVHRLK